MASTTDKELKVLSVLVSGSDKPQKQLAGAAGLSESDFSRTKNDLVSRGVIRKFTIEIDYKKIGYPDIGVMFVAIIDKQKIAETAAAIAQIPEAIAVFEVFGREYDLVVKLMCKTNEDLRAAGIKITDLENVRAGQETYTIIYSRIFKDTPGVPI